MRQRAGLIFVLLLLAFLVRFYRIIETTEFLGDQGAAAMAIMDAVLEREFLLVGPPTSTGLYHGPFYYYLIAPALIVAQYRPELAVLWMTSFGVASVYLLFIVGERLFGSVIGYSISLMYAISPWVVIQNRTLWNPTTVPFFVLLAILLLHNYITSGKARYVFFLGVTTALLLQLHYTNIFVFGILGTYLWWMMHKHSLPGRRRLITFCLYIVGFLLCMSPFLFHEIGSAFTETRSLLLHIFFSPDVQYDWKPHSVTVFNFAKQLFRNVFGILNDPSLLLLEAGVLVAIIIQKNRWVSFFGLWYLGGLGFLLIFKGHLVDHYTNFLLPIPFLLVGGALKIFYDKLPRWGFAAMIMLLLSMLFTSKQLYASPYNDIARTEHMIEAMIHLSSGRPFTYSLLSSRSYSDFHYQYFFRLKKTTYMPLQSQETSVLFLICDTPGKCPTYSEMDRAKDVFTLCSEFHCEGTYPDVRLKEWSLSEVRPVDGGMLYEYLRS